MKIVYYSPHPNINMAAPSGPGTHIREVIAAFESQGHQVIRLIAGGETLSPQSQSAIQFRKRTYKKFIPSVIWQSLKDWKLRRFDAHMKSELRRVIGEHKPDAIYERGYYLMSSGFEEALRNSIPYFCEINAPYPEEKKHMEGVSLFGIAAKRNERKQALAAKRIFVVSSALKDYLIARTGVSQERIVVTPNGVNPDYLRVNPEEVAGLKKAMSFDENDVVIGFVGSIFPYHGVDLLLTAFLNLKKSGRKNIRLLIVGDGEILPQLKQFAAENDLTGDVVFTGNIPHKQVFTYIDVMNITVMARSNWYGSPVKIFEYGALGKKIIAPNVVPVLDVMKDGVDGLLVNDSELELENALRQMMDNESKANAMAQNFRQKVLSLYTWNRIGEMIIKNMK